MGLFNDLLKLILGDPPSPRHEPTLAVPSTSMIVDDESENAHTGPGSWSVRLTGTFKSIKPLSWDDIPPLAVLTGPNGSGKSQLLAAIHSGVANAVQVREDERKLADIRKGEGTYRDILGRYAKVDKEKQSDEVQQSVQHARAQLSGYQSQSWEVTSRIARTPSATIELGGRRSWTVKDPGAVILASDAFQGGKSHPIAAANVSRLISSVGDRGYRHDLQHTQQRSAHPGTRPVTAETLARSPGLAVDLAEPLDGLGLAMQAHRLEEFHRYEREKQGEAPLEDPPPPPHEVMNDLLKEVGFPLRVSAPKRRIDESEPVRFLSQGVEVQVEDLSSGERTLIGLVSALYAGRSGARLPALFLLDEPDAHLHPSLTAQVLTAIRSVLVERLGVRVLLTTHSPSTVALAPDDAVFVIRDGAVHKTDKWEAVSTLTAGIVTVGPHTKHVFVEDIDDAAFYTAAAAVTEALDPTFPKGRLVFLPANKDKADPSKPGDGGCTRVLAWVGDMQTPSVAGLIDRDGAAVDVLDPQRIWRVGRHSLENYLLDPLLLATFVARIQNKPLNTFKPFVGNERALLSASAAELQPVVDEVVAAVAQPLHPTADTDPHEIAYVNGPTLTVPGWWLSTRGHDLYKHIQPALGFPPVPAKLTEMLTLTRLVPDELAAIFRKIAAS